MRGLRGGQQEDSRYGTGKDNQLMLAVCAGLLGFIVILALTPFLLRRFGCLAARQRRLQEDAANARAHSNAPRESPIDAEQRQLMIDACLVSTFVTEVKDPSCGNISPAKRDDASLEATIRESDINSANTTDEECGLAPSQPGEAAGTAPCHICLEPFQVGEIMSVSKVSGCDHAFHCKCITEWLQNHNDCPCCRSQFMATEQCTNKEAVILPQEQHPE